MRGVDYLIYKDMNKPVWRDVNNRTSYWNIYSKEFMIPKLSWNSDPGLWRLHATTTSWAFLFSSWFSIVEIIKVSEDVIENEETIDSM